MWTPPHRRDLSSDSDNDSLKSKTTCRMSPYRDVEEEKSKMCSYSPLSDGASFGTTKTTQLSPLSLGSTSTPPVSPTNLSYFTSSRNPGTDLDLHLDFCESDECATTASKQLPSSSIISRRIRNEWTNDFDQKQTLTYRLTSLPDLLRSVDGSESMLQHCNQKLLSESRGDLKYSLSSRIYALRRGFGTKSLAMALLSMMSCSVAVISIVNGRFHHHKSYDLHSLWEIKVAEFRPPKLYHFSRSMLSPTEDIPNNTAAHTLVSGLRPIYRFDKVERVFGELDWKRGLGEMDSSMYSTKLISKPSGVRHPQIFNMHSNHKGDPNNGIIAWPFKRYIDRYPAVFSDNTQLYGIRSSDDEALSKMEIGDTLDSDECVPIKKWQMAYYPSCNEIHTIDLKKFDGDVMGGRISLLGTKGYWRNVWKVDVTSSGKALRKRETVVLKTLKYNHNFEHAHYERDRIDALAMEKLTSSPHVVNIYGFCGRSILNEFADGPGLGALADKSKKHYLKRLKIARDIASGLADVHGISGSSGNSTITHMDINPANVVVVDHNLKLNDFNIAVMMKWNKTSSTQCGFPSRYPNPQWRSPEEASESQHLTEKIDVFSMGHIFFRMICGHEPWNKLEKGGRPTAMEITNKVKEGTLPRIPEEIKQTSDPEIKAILAAMLACYTTEPTERPSSRTIANFLDKEWQKLSRNA